MYDCHALKMKCNFPKRATQPFTYTNPSDMGPVEYIFTKLHVIESLVTLMIFEVLSYIQKRPTGRAFEADSEFKIMKLLASAVLLF